MSEFPLLDKKILIIQEKDRELLELENRLMELGATVSMITQLHHPRQILNADSDLLIVTLYRENPTLAEFTAEIKRFKPALQLFILTQEQEILQHYPAILATADYIYTSQPNLPELLTAISEALLHPEERRSDERYRNILPVFWIARYYRELKKSDLFESPHLLNISAKGLSFQSYFHYDKNDELLVWLACSHCDDKSLLELFGNVVWAKEINQPGEEGLKKYQYGVEIQASANSQLQHFLGQLKDNEPE